MKQNLLRHFKLRYPKIILICFVQLLFLGSKGYGQEAYTVNIDFGSTMNTTLGAWNNITDPKAGAIENLINNQGINTGIKIAITDAFNADNSDGLELDGSYGIPASASGDSFFGNTADWG